MTLVHAPIAIAPALLFLAALLVLDSYKLVRLRAVLAALAAGAIAAALLHVVHTSLVDRGFVTDRTLVRLVAPVTEETAKALFVIFLLQSGRVGFLVDAAIAGFAVGTGMAVAENVFYLSTLTDQPLLLWLVRGLGTAVLHGATTALFAMLAKTLSERHPRHSIAALMPGGAAAVLVHSAFNHLILPPVAMTGLLLTVLPVTILLVFDRSERATREWVTGGLDIALTLLALIESPEFAATRFGTYLGRLKARFPGVIVADMFCLLRLEVELSVQARARLLARGAGVELPMDDDLPECLEEIDYLKQSIGATGRLALEPLRVTTRHDDWHRHVLRQTSGRARRWRLTP